MSAAVAPRSCQGARTTRTSATAAAGITAAAKNAAARTAIAAGTENAAETLCPATDATASTAICAREVVALGDPPYPLIKATPPIAVGCRSLCNRRHIRLQLGSEFKKFIHVSRL